MKDYGKKRKNVRHWELLVTQERKKSKGEKGIEERGRGRVPIKRKGKFWSQS